MTHSKPTVNERLTKTNEELIEALIAIQAEMKGMAQNELINRARIARLEKYLDALRELTGHLPEAMDEMRERLHPTPVIVPEGTEVIDPSMPVAGVTLPEPVNVLPFTAPGEAVPVLEPEPVPEDAPDVA